MKSPQIADSAPLRRNIHRPVKRPCLRRASSALRLSFAVALIAGCAQTTEPRSPAGIPFPILDADAIRALRKPNIGPELVVVFEKSDRASKRSSAKKTTLTLGLGRDYFHVTRGSVRIVVDFRLRQEMHADLRKRSVISMSLYSDIGFRAFELHNRIRVRRITQKAGRREKSRNFEQFWIESEMGLIAPKEKRPNIISSKKSEKRFRFTYAGAEVARVRLSNQSIPDQFSKSFKKFLLLHTRLHPKIVENLVKTGKLPAKLSYVSTIPGEKGGTTFVLKSTTRANADYPLPAGFKNGASDVFIQAGKPKALPGELFPIARKAIDGTYGGGFPTVPRYLDKLENLVRTRTPLEIKLFLIEFEMMFPNAFSDCRAGHGDARRCSIYGASILATRKNADVLHLKKSMAAETKGDHRRAVKLLRGFRRKNMANSYILDRMLANSLTSILRKQSRAVESPKSHARTKAISREVEPLFLRALRGNPYFSHIYYDIGLYYGALLQFDTAWLFYDLGRALPSRPPNDFLRYTDAYEARLLRDFPHIFEF